VIGLLGDPGPLTWKRSRRGGTATDRAAEQVLARLAPTLGMPARVMDFEPYGYDERQFCSPGFDLPVGRLTRSPNAAYPEYHTSADNLDLVSPEALAESIRVLATLVATLDANRWITNLSPRGEPRLGKRGLYGTMGGTEPGQFENALLWLLSQGDGGNDLVGVAGRSGLPFDLVARAATALEGAHLLSSTSRAPGAPAPEGS
jgi:aminopeptidase-like protein